MLQGRWQNAPRLPLSNTSLVSANEPAFVATINLEYDIRRHAGGEPLL